MGRPKKKTHTIKKEVLLTEPQLNVFKELFLKWVPSRELSIDCLTPEKGKKLDMRKNVHTTIGRYLNLFMKHKWLDKKFDSKLFEQRNGLKRQRFPIYKANSKIFFDFYALTEDDFNLSLFNHSQEIRKIDFFIGLDEVREMILFEELKDIYSIFGLYDSFKRNIEKYLMFNWAYFLGYLNISENFHKIEVSLFAKSFEDLKINFNSLVKKEFISINEKEEFIKTFNEIWLHFTKQDYFLDLLRINKNMNSKIKDKEVLKKILKIKCYSLLFFSEDSFEILRKYFLDKTANQLISNLRGQ